MQSLQDFDTCLHLTRLLLSKHEKMSINKCCKPGFSTNLEIGKSAMFENDPTAHANNQQTVG